MDPFEDRRPEVGKLGPRIPKPDIRAETRVRDEPKQDMKTKIMGHTKADGTNRVEARKYGPKDKHMGNFNDATIRNENRAPRMSKFGLGSGRSRMITMMMRVVH